jgi:hypothetical protein
MSELAKIYKTANDTVLQQWHDDPEDNWKLNAVTEHRAGIRVHDSVMAEFAEKVEQTVTELLAAPIPEVVMPTVSPNAKPSAPKPAGEHLPKTPDNPKGLDLGWD